MSTRLDTDSSQSVDLLGSEDGLAEAVARRRNFAIISHPDAGKTTLTEKLLLYGGAIQQAGAVKARGEQRKVTSDWMELEKQRGISITYFNSRRRKSVVPEGLFFIKWCSRLSAVPILKKHLILILHI